jgi:hypothetical protein
MPFPDRRRGGGRGAWGLCGDRSLGVSEGMRRWEGRGGGFSWGSCGG